MFVIILLGFLLGRLRVRGIGLDAAGALFVALAFGHVYAARPTWNLADPGQFKVIGDHGPSVIMVDRQLGARQG